MNADVILPLCASNEASLYVSLVGLRTCQASTTARILVLCNNTKEEPFPWRRRIQENCEALGVRFHYVEGPFNIAKIFNLGTSMTKGDYIAYATADVIYYPNWFENIVDLWQDEPDYWTLSNYSFDTRIMPCVKRHTLPERKIVQTGNPSAGLNVFKRSSKYMWDEQFPLWEIDADLHYHLAHYGLKAGICLNARADHMIQGIRPHIDYAVNFGISDADKEFFTEPRIKLEKKWGLERPKELQ